MKAATAMLNGRRCRIRLRRPVNGLPAGYETAAVCSCAPPGLGGWAGWTVLVDGREIDVHESDAVEAHSIKRANDRIK